MSILVRMHLISSISNSQQFTKLAKFMKTSSISSDLNGFVLPNVNTLKESKRQIITDAGNFKTSFLPDIQLKCKRLSKSVSELSSTIQNSVTLIRSDLANEQIDSYLNDIQDILTELQNPELSEEDRPLLLEAEQEQRELLKKDISNLEILVEKHEKVFYKELSNIKNILIKERLTNVIPEKEDKKKSIEDTIKEKEKSQQDLDQERSAVIESLDIMREENLIDMFQDMLPTPEDINKLNLTQPKIAALQEGIRIYKKMLGNISGGLQYAKLAECRDDLTAQIDEIKREIRSERTSLTEVEDQISDTSNMISIDDQKSLYVEEVEKIIRSFRFFYTRLDGFNKIQATVYTEIKQLFAEMLSYLNKLNVPL